MALFGYLTGYHPPGLQDPEAWQRVTRTLIDAHRSVVDLFPRAGVCLQMPNLQGDEELRATAQHETIDIYLEDLPRRLLRRSVLHAHGARPADAGTGRRPARRRPLTQMGWEIHPEGLLKALRSPRAPACRSWSPRTGSRPPTTISASTTSSPTWAPSATL